MTAALVSGKIFEQHILIFQIVLCIIEKEDSNVSDFTHHFKEKQRIEYMLSNYQDELSILPKGTISEKVVGEKTYYHLKFGASKKEINDVREQIEKRRHIEAMVKSLQKEKLIADKVLEGAI